MQQEKITFRLSIFEGPLDLLLYLIRTQEIDIRDIPIIKITEQYLDMLNLMKELNLDVAGEYLVIAATLIHIKSRMLLPAPPSEEEEELEDPREELVQKLLEYERFKKVSEVLYEKRSLEGATFPKGYSEPDAEIEEDDLTIEANLFDLVAAFKTVLETLENKPSFEIRPLRFSLKEKAEQILQLCGRKKNATLIEVLSMQGVKEELIACFLALLELMRLGAIRAYQSQRFGEIVIRSTGCEVDLLALEQEDRNMGVEES
ncbi:segregation and condensation protein A [Acidobacteriota bacterium]